MELIMDWHYLAEGALSLLMLVIGWVSRELWDAIKDLRKDLAKLREEIPGEYVRKDDYREDLQRLYDKIENGFSQLLARIDNQSDRWDERNRKG